MIPSFITGKTSWYLISNKNLYHLPTPNLLIDYDPMKNNIYYRVSILLKSAKEILAPSFNSPGCLPRPNASRLSLHIRYPLVIVPLQPEQINHLISTLLNHVDNELMLKRYQYKFAWPKHFLWLCPIVVLKIKVSLYQISSMPKGKFPKW